jgi:hypothetical protein
MLSFGGSTLSMQSATTPWMRGIWIAYTKSRPRSLRLLKSWQLGLRLPKAGACSSYFLAARGTIMKEQVAEIVAA